MSRRQLRKVSQEDASTTDNRAVFAKWHLVGKAKPERNLVVLRRRLVFVHLVRHHDVSAKIVEVERERWVIAIRLKHVKPKVSQVKRTGTFCHPLLVGLVPQLC